MLTKDDLFEQCTLPNIKDISLELYKNFSIDVLLKQKFHYYFTDDSEIIIEFREWGIYHMLAIHHIDNRINKNNFFEKIDNGLKLETFERDIATKQRYKKRKTRITAFSCIYNTLLNGTAFYLPSGRVKNTANVEVDYIIFDRIDGKGINYGLRKVGDVHVPITILLAGSTKATYYLEESEFKLIKRVDVLDENGNIIESRIHNTQSNPLEENKSSALNTANNIIGDDKTESDTESTTPESTEK